MYSSVYVLSLGCRGTAYRRADLRRNTGRTHPNRLYLTSPVSCTTRLKFKVVIFFFNLLSHFCGLTLCSVLLLLFFFFFLFVCVVWSSSIARGGHSGGTVAGMRGLVSSVRFCKCPPYIHHQTIKLTLQPSITVSLSPPRPLLSESERKPPQASC